MKKCNLEPHSKTGGFSITLGRGNTRIDYDTIFATGRHAAQTPKWDRSKNLRHYHRKDPGGIGRHRPWHTKIT
ncbi:hypothetical protein [Glaciecola sp. MF2-115]|uniref:hypothetical protein n=1 Tax=Glaciecola sp. MF2-115 TaxID=3384827 RepID=UPI0039A0E7D5